MKGKVLESITPEGFHLVERIHESLYWKGFYLTKKRYFQKFDELINKIKVAKSAANITDKRKCSTFVSSRKLTHTETNLLVKGVNFSVTSKTLTYKAILATIED